MSNFYRGDDPRREAAQERRRLIGERTPLRAVSRTTSPPSNPSPRDYYLVDGSGAGIWTGESNVLMRYTQALGPHITKQQSADTVPTIENDLVDPAGSSQNLTVEWWDAADPASMNADDQEGVMACGAFTNGTGGFKLFFTGGPKLILRVSNVNGNNDDYTLDPGNYADLYDAGLSHVAIVIDSDNSQITVWKNVQTKVIDQTLSTKMEAPTGDFKWWQKEQNNDETGNGHARFFRVWTEARSQSQLQNNYWREQSPPQTSDGVFEDFETGLGFKALPKTDGGKDFNRETFARSDVRAFRGSWSARTNLENYSLDSDDVLGKRREIKEVQPDWFRYAFYINSSETTKGGGGTFRMTDKNGDVELAIGTDGEGGWWIHDNNGGNKVKSTSAVDEWVVFQVYFDWNNGQFDARIESQSSGVTHSSSNRPLKKGNGVKTLRAEQLDEQGGIATANGSVDSLVYWDQVSLGGYDVRSSELAIQLPIRRRQEKRVYTDDVEGLEMTLAGDFIPTPMPWWDVLEPRDGEQIRVMDEGDGGRVYTYDKTNDQFVPEGGSGYSAPDVVQGIMTDQNGDVMSDQDGHVMWGEV